MLKKTVFTAAAIALAFAAQPAAAAQLKWVGCGISKKGFMAAMAKAYQAETGIEILVEGGGATRGIRDTASGASDMGGSCRHKLLVDEERNARMIPIGWDAIVAITHPDNPVKRISLDNLKAIFEGRITNWKDLGGPSVPIELVVRKGKTSGVGLLVRELLFFDPERDFPAGAIRLKSSGPVEKHIEANPYAIAFTGISSGRKRNVNFLGIDDVEPSYENIAKGAYSLVRPLYLVIPKHPSEEVAQFVRYATGPQGQEIVRQEGTVNLIDGAGLWPKFRRDALIARREGAF